MREPKMIVSDLDGTLFDARGGLSPLTVQTLETLTDRGIRLVLATGRHHRDVRGLFAHTGLNFALVSSNGARVHDENSVCLLSRNLTSRQVSRTLAIASTFKGIHLNVYTEAGWNLITPFPHAEERIRQGRLPFHRRSRHQLAQLAGIKVFLYGQPDSLLACAEKLQHYPDLDIDLTRSTDSTLEAMPRGASKGTALALLLRHVGLTPEDAIVFGDAMNDYEMLQLAGTPVIMDNAMEALKTSLPNVPRARPHDKDGVALYLRDVFGLN